ncbi:MAG: class I SAM-dependent methyltransferase, partial [Thermoanaerobaculia bacterium]
WPVDQEAMKEQRIKSDRFWDWSAARYDRRVRQDERYEKAVERFAKYLEPEHAVLDYACGPGVITFKIAGAVREVHGIDTSAGMIEVAKRRVREEGVANVRFDRMSIFDPELQRDSYDVVLAFNIWHLLEDPARTLERAAEILKPGGVLVSSTPCAGEAGVLLRVLLLLVRGVGMLSYLKSLTVSDIEDLMANGGLTVVESKALERTLPVFFVVARKG